MTSEFYFKPAESALTRDQVIGQLGFDPDGMGEEIILSYGLFPVHDDMESKGVLDNPHPVYRNMGTYYLKCPSPSDIDLVEGKFIVKEILCKTTNSDLENLTKEFGFEPYLVSSLPLLSGLETSPLLKEFKSRQLEIVSDLDKNLLRVEQSKSIEDLRQILNP